MVFFHKLSNDTKKKLITTYVWPRDKTDATLKPREKNLYSTLHVEIIEKSVQICWQFNNQSEPIFLFDQSEQTDI